MRFQRACFVGDLLKSALHLYKPKCQQVKVSARWRFVLNKQRPVCVPLYCQCWLKIIMFQTFFTWVGRDELGDEEACRGPRHVHHGPRGFIKQSLVRVDASNTHGPVPNVETEKGIVWELEGNWIDWATLPTALQEVAMTAIFIFLVASFEFLTASFK